MELSRIVGSLALFLAAVVVTGYALGQQDSPPTAKETAQAK